MNQTPTPEACPKCHRQRNLGNSPNEYECHETDDDEGICKAYAKIRKLFRERDEAKKYELAYQTFVKAYGESPSDFAAKSLIELNQLRTEVEQLRKVADELVIALEHQGVTLRTLQNCSFESMVTGENIDRLLAEALLGYSQLPHVLERNKAK